MKRSCHTEGRIIGILKNGEIREIFKALAAARPQWGQDCLQVLMCRQGVQVNHTRTERLNNRILEVR